MFNPFNTDRSEQVLFTQWSKCRRELTNLYRVDDDLTTNPLNKALVRSKNLTALTLALSQKICAHAQFLQDLALTLALKSFWAPLNFALILDFLKIGKVQQINVISVFKSFLGQFFPDISKKLVAYYVNFKFWHLGVFYLSQNGEN